MKQLSLQHNRDRFVKDSEFYKGEEPNFNLITRNVDVIKTLHLNDFKYQIIELLKQDHSTIIPMFFITGDFGIGKSTFALRLISELEKEEELDLVAFEIIDFNRSKKSF
jgi:predicted ATP-dependent serine protease